MAISINRRIALRAVAALGSIGAVGALGTSAGRSTAQATRTGSRMLHVEVDTVVFNGVIFSRDGGVWQQGTPRQQGDHCNIAWRLHEPDKTDGEPVGDWHCIGPWAGSTKEKGTVGPGFLVFAQFELYGRGKLSGMIYCGANPQDGTVTGGTGEFHGATGSFRWEAAVAPASRLKFSLILPDTSAVAASRTAEKAMGGAGDQGASAQDHSSHH